MQRRSTFIDLALAGGLFAAFALTSATGAAAPSTLDEAERGPLAATADGALLAAPKVVLDLPAAPPPALLLPIRLGDEDVVLQLQRHSVLADDYRLFVIGEDGIRREAEPGPVRTYRGVVQGVPGSLVAGSILETGFHGRIAMPGEEECWVQPLTADQIGRAGAVPGTHAVYTGTDIPDEGFSCDLDAHREQAAAAAPAPMRRMPAGIAPAAAPGPLAERVIGAPGGGGQDGGSLFLVAEMAADADTEYFQDYGSVAAVEARIQSVTNTMNLQYETQLELTHEITAIIVRTGTDPYTQGSSFGRLCQFITEWTENQQDIQRDVAQLFTGFDIQGGTIGRAADIGNTGICVPTGCCNCGEFDTEGSYCFSQSDFNGVFGCATDLSAHELGHLWGAFHCFCSSFTMNPSITCANQFSTESINSIIAYRDTRACLDDPLTAGCCLENGICITVAAESECLDQGGVFQGLGTTCDDVECEPQFGACCFDDGTCFDVTPSFCGDLGGVFQGAGTVCASTDCDPEPDCPADFDGDGTVGTTDLLELLADFGPCGPGCGSDIDGDGVVDTEDLLALLAEWGDC